MEETHGKKLRRGPIRRPANVPEWDRFTWDSSIHEAGHVLTAMCVGVGVRDVFVPRLVDYSQKLAPYTTMAPGLGWAPEAAALANAAGNGAEWSRGGRSKSFSRTDRQGFVDALGSDARLFEFAGAAADFLRLPSLAGKLETLATFFYRRQGEVIDTGRLWTVVRIDRADHDAVDAALVRLGSPAGRYASQEDREARERQAASWRAIATKHSQEPGRPSR